MDGWVSGLRSQSKSTRDSGLFKEAADRTLDTMEAAGAWQSGGPGASFTLLRLSCLIQSIADAIKLMGPIILRRNQFRAKMIHL